MSRLTHHLPRGSSLASPVACGQCGARVPLLGWPGRSCTWCGEATGYDRVEWVLALAFGSLALRLAPDFTLLARSIETAALLAVAAIDLRHRLVYRVISYPATLLSLFLSSMLPGLDILRTALGLAVAVALFAALYWAGRLLYREVEPMATGDVAIAGLIGAMVGFPQVLVALVLGSLAVGAWGVAGLLARRLTRRTFLPYAPGLCLGAFFTFFLSP